MRCHPKFRHSNKKITKEEFFKRIEKTDYCWNWIGFKDRSGYGFIKWDGRHQRSHRIMYMIHHNIVLPKGRGSSGTIVLHKCDNTSCVNPDHLFLGTQLDNVRDMMNKGRGNHPGIKGIKNGMAKLNEILVKEIRKYKKNNPNISQKNIGKLFNVSQMTICRVLNRVLWGHVK